MSFWGVGASVLGGVIAADAAGDAADLQADASASERALQKSMFDQTRADQAPYRDVGYSALARLQTLLGLSPDTTTTTGGQGVETYAQIRERLAPKFTNPAFGGNGVDDAGLDSAAKREFDSQVVRRLFNASGGPKNKDFGLLTRQFTGANLVNDPGYQFGLGEGTKALQRSATAAGAGYSGATLKALQRYSQDYAGTKFGEAFNRDAAYKDSLFNRLSGLSGTGQTATNRVGEAGRAYADASGNSLIGEANAMAANRVNQGNIWSNVINSGLSAWQRGSSGTPDGY